MKMSEIDFVCTVQGCNYDTRKVQNKGNNKKVGMYSHTFHNHFLNGYKKFRKIAKNGEMKFQCIKCEHILNYKSIPYHAVKCFDICTFIGVPLIQEQEVVEPEPEVVEPEPEIVQEEIIEVTQEPEVVEQPEIIHIIEELEVTHEDDEDDEVEEDDEDEEEDEEEVIIYHKFEPIKIELTLVLPEQKQSQPNILAYWFLIIVAILVYRLSPMVLQFFIKKYSSNVLSYNVENYMIEF